MSIDYEDEIGEILEEAGDRYLEWLKLEPREKPYKIKFLDNGTEYTNEYEGEKIEGVRYKVVEGRERKFLGVSKSSSLKSLWGQLVAYAREQGGLEDQILTVDVSWNDPEEQDFTRRRVREAEQYVKKIVKESRKA